MLCYTCNYELYAVDYTGDSPHFRDSARLELGIHIHIPFRPGRTIGYNRSHTHPLIRSRVYRMIRLMRVRRGGQREDQSESAISSLVFVKKL
jgi:hypothetical protein